MHGKPKIQNPFQANKEASSQLAAPSSGLSADLPASSSQDLKDELTHVGQAAAARDLEDDVAHMGQAAAAQDPEDDLAPVSQAAVARGLGVKAAMKAMMA